MTDWSSHPPRDDTEILLVEDDATVVELIETELGKAEPHVDLQTFSNGYDAVYFLKKRSATDPPSVPDLALLDLNVPGKDGCEILRTIKNDSQLRRLPSIILTGTSDREDAARCYDAHANAYVPKPEEPEEFAKLIEVIEKFWIERVQLPPVPE